MMAQHRQGGMPTPEEFTPEELGDYTPHNPIVLREKPRVTDDEPRMISMGHYAAFNESPPEEPTPPLATQPKSIGKNLIDEIYSK